MYKYFRPRIRSRHPSHSPLRRGTLPLFPFKSVIRFGSSKEFEDDRIEVNTVNAIKNSSSKLLMKQCFTKGKVQTAQWFRYINGLFVDQNNDDEYSLENLSYPIISKSLF